MFRHNGNSKFFNRNRCELSFSFKLQGRDFGEHVKSDQGSSAIAFGLTHLVELQRFVFHELSHSAHDGGLDRDVYR